MPVRARDLLRVRALWVIPLVVASVVVAVMTAVYIWSVVNPLAIQAMQEIGIDISNQWSKSVNEFLDQPFDYVITVCDQAAEVCPIFPGSSQQVHWSFPDPAAAQGTEAARLQAFRQVRDDIKARFEQWIEGKSRQD